MDFIIIVDIYVMVILYSLLFWPFTTLIIVIYDQITIINFTERYYLF